MNNIFSLGLILACLLTCNIARKSINELSAIRLKADRFVSTAIQYKNYIITSKRIIDNMICLYVEFKR